MDAPRCILCGEQHWSREACAGRKSAKARVKAIAGDEFGRMLAEIKPRWGDDKYLAVIEKLRKGEDQKEALAVFDEAERRATGGPLGMDEIEYSRGFERLRRKEQRVEAIELYDEMLRRVQWANVTRRMAERGELSQTESQLKLSQVIVPTEERRRGRPPEGERAISLTATKPWEAEGISRTEWYRRQKGEGV